MITVKHYDEYNGRRYSRPWICEMSESGEYLFKAPEKAGTFDGDDKRGGNLVIFKPVEGKVYGYGQRDYRGNYTEVNHVKYVNGELLPCSKLGVLEEAV